MSDRDDDFHPLQHEAFVAMAEQEERLGQTRQERLGTVRGFLDSERGWSIYGPYHADPGELRKVRESLRTSIALGCLTPAEALLLKIIAFSSWPNNMKERDT